eukprot:COSAG02_NODE_12840_length_1484_cov_15.360289_2_plen_78_part_00
MCHRGLIRIVLIGRGMGGGAARGRPREEAVPRGRSRESRGLRVAGAVKEPAAYDGGAARAPSDVQFDDAHGGLPDDP